MSVVTFALMLDNVWGQLPASQSAAPTTTTEQGQFRTGFPLVLRFSEALFHSAEPEVATQKPVQRCILGVYVHGTADINGQLFPRFADADEGMRLSLHFAGGVVSRTAGTQGPATVHTTTVADFRASVPIAFEKSAGFTAGQVQVHVQNMQKQSCISTPLPGLRGRLVRRVARKRLQNQQLKLRAIAISQIKRSIAEDFDQQISKELTRWNQQWEALHAALVSQSWYSAEQSLQLASMPGYLLLLFDPRSDLQGWAASQPRFADAPLPALRADLEIIWRNEWLESKVSEKGVQKGEMLMKTVRALLEEMLQQPVEEYREENWTVLSISKMTNGRQRQ